MQQEIQAVFNEEFAPSASRWSTGFVLLDHQLYLPESWAADLARREKTRVPPESTFQTKPEIAAALLARSSVRFDWVIADEAYGRDGAFLDTLEAANQQYVYEQARQSHRKTWLLKRPRVACQQVMRRTSIP